MSCLLASSYPVRVILTKVSSQSKSAVSETYPENKNSKKSVASSVSLHIYNVRTKATELQSLMKPALKAEGYTSWSTQHCKHWRIQGGAPGTRPLGVQILSFSRIFRQKWEK